MNIVELPRVSSIDKVVYPTIYDISDNIKQCILKNRFCELTIFIIKAKLGNENINLKKNVFLSTYVIRNYLNSN